jgi:hypothetical protein
LATGAELNRQAIRARLDLVAHEHDLPAAEISKAKSSERALVDFAYRHDLSFDWLILGDLRGRLRMAKWAAAGARAGG